MKLLNKVKSILLIIFFMTLIFAGKSFAVTGEITEITVNMRKEPSTDSKKIMYVTQDDIVEVLEKDGEWYKIKFKGKTGYVFGEYLKVDDSKLEVTENKKEEEKVETTENDTSTKTEETPKKEESKNDVQDVTVDVPADLQIKEKTDIRLIPNITSSVIYTAKKAVSIKVIEQLNEWSYISVDNIVGWVRTDKIVEKNAVSSENKEDKTEKKEEEKTSNSEVKETKTAYIKYDKVNLRKKASTSSTVLAKLKLNDKVTVLEEVDSKWSKVKVDGITGYVSTELLSDKKQEVKEEKKEEENITSRDSETTSRKEEVKEDTKTETKQEENKTTEKKDETIKEESKENTSSKVTGSDIVEFAKKYLGYAYVSGGASPKTGFDCSGFTKYVYNHFGYTLSRTSKAQAKNGKEVAKSDLQPGDLIIFKNQSLTAIGHVGIYIGNNKIIHASEPGVGVVITDMNASGYNYNKRYVTARRII